MAAWINGLTAANTAKDGTGTLETIFTADATNGGYLQRVIARPRGTTSQLDLLDLQLSVGCHGLVEYKDSGTPAGF